MLKNAILDMSAHMDERRQLLKQTKHIILLALFIALSLLLFMLESMLPLPLPAPGAKLGLANLVTVAALYILGTRDAIVILITRVMISSMLGGGPTIFMYSVSGASLSLAVMALLKRTHLFSVIGVSAAGGFAHNVAQTAIAALLIESSSIFLYLPVLGPLGIATGLLIGIVAGRIISAVTHHQKAV